MLTDDMQLAHRHPYSTRPDLAWLSGALAAVGEKAESSDWSWNSFLEDVLDMIRNTGEITPCEPGIAPEGESGYDVLGGYVSVSGRMTEDGLRFRVPLGRQEKLLQMFGSLVLLKGQRTFVVPKHDLARFTRLVPLRGPITEKLEEIYA